MDYSVLYTWIKVGIAAVVLLITIANLLEKKSARVAIAKLAYGARTIQSQYKLPPTRKRPKLEAGSRFLVVMFLCYVAAHLWVVVGTMMAGIWIEDLQGLRFLLALVAIILIIGGARLVQCIAHKEWRDIRALFD